MNSFFNGAIFELRSHKWVEAKSIESKAVDVVESTQPGRLICRESESRAENGTFENLQEGFTQDNEESPLWDQVGELDRGQIVKDFGHLFRNVILILMASGRFMQGSYMIRFSSQKSFQMQYREWIGRRQTSVQGDNVLQWPIWKKMVISVRVLWGKLDTFKSFSTVMLGYWNWMGNFLCHAMRGRQSRWFLGFRLA